MVLKTGKGEEEGPGKRRGRNVSTEGRSRTGDERGEGNSASLSHWAREKLK